MITPHFSHVELVRTQHSSLQGEPDTEVLLNAHVLAASVLEPIRYMWGGPIRVNSWWRSRAVNKEVKGRSSSLHLTGQAADIQPLVGTRVLLWQQILEMVELGLPVTTAIVYTHKSHVHVSYRWRDPIRETQLYLARPGELVPWRRIFEQEVV